MCVLYVHMILWTYDTLTCVQYVHKIVCTICTQFRVFPVQLHISVYYVYTVMCAMGTQCIHSVIFYY